MWVATLANVILMITLCMSAFAVDVPLVTSTEYPHGHDNHVVTTDPLGVQTISRKFYDSTCKIEETISAGVTNRLIRIHNGAEITEKYWNNKRKRESQQTDFTPQGTRIELTTTETSDLVGTLTNSITRYDFLGRIVATQTPAFGGGWLTTSNYYHGSTSRLARSTRTGEPDTLYVYNKMGELIGETRNGISILTESSYETIAGSTWRVIQQSRVVDTTTNIISITREQLNNLAAGTQAHTVTIAANGSTTTATTTFDQNTHRRTTIHQTDDATPIITVTLYGRVIEQTTLSEKRYNYFDPLGRICGYSIHDPQTDQTLYSHQAELDMSGTPTNQITQYGALTVTKSSAYDILGRETTSTDALGHATTNSYDALGNLTQRTGATYPVRYTYDSLGRMRTLATTRDGSTWDTTQWLYDHSGAVTNKIYADNAAISYTYTSNYSPLRTTWARRDWKENSYNDAGQIESVTYSDSTPNTTLSYDDFQYMVSASNSGASYLYANDHLGTATNKTAIIGGTVHSLTRIHDEYHRLEQINVNNSTTHYEYDTENRLATLSNNIFTLQNLYTSDNRDAGNTITLHNSNTISREVIRDLHRRQLITAITNSVNGTPYKPLAFSYNVLNHLTQRNDDIFDYNARAEVITANIQPAHNSKYDYDHIGNNLWSVLNNTTNYYVVNNLNQYTSISAPMREPQYDQDGNLIYDGAFTYTWDSENRLTAVYTNNALVVSNAYDHANRRVLKVTPNATHTYLYDGWNLVQETIQNQQSTITNHFVWGKDLSGTLQGAGGVGGLVAVSINNAWYFPLYDNNGNVLAYVNSTGIIVAEYAYDAFGNTINQSGSLANAFPHRFSTKYYDVETNLYYYGYRFYSPALMRWFNRDPRQEQGGLNLFHFVFNKSIYAVDTDGRFVFPIIIIPPRGDEVAPPPPIPSILDHFGNSISPLGEEFWFEKNYPG